MVLLLEKINGSSCLLCLGSKLAGGHRPRSCEAKPAFYFRDEPQRRGRARRTSPSGDETGQSSSKM
jgi:hypothetical protein